MNRIDKDRGGKTTKNDKKDEKYKEKDKKSMREEEREHKKRHIITDRQKMGRNENVKDRG